jgi:CBS domain-containing protein
VSAPDPLDPAGAAAATAAHRRVGEVMRTPLVTADRDETCRDVASRMREHHVSAVVVIGRGELLPGDRPRDLLQAVQREGRAGGHDHRPAVHRRLHAVDDSPPAHMQELIEEIRLPGKAPETVAH